MQKEIEHKMAQEKVMLFNGANFDGWKVMRTGGIPAWKAEDGIMTVEPRTGCIVSEYEFGDAHVHVEFLTPRIPGRTGQERSNSGVFIHGCYEVQVLESYGVEEMRDNECGGIYSQYTPLCNACNPPEEWQAYDIIVRAPRFNEYDEVAENGRMTVIMNGVVIHNNIELPRACPGGSTGNKRVRKGPLMLQDHCDRVSFRNIWVMPLE